MMKAYMNGKIYTVNENRDWAEAVVIDGSKIAYVGDNAGAEAFIAGKDAEVTDMNGKLMLPGFIDGHCHPIMAAFYNSEILLNGFYTLDEMLAEIKRYVAEHPGKKYYSGKGVEEVWFVENKMNPDKSMLEGICDDVPMVLLGTSGHVAWCNACALEKAGITKDTPDPHPGRSYFARDEEGNPTGYLVETLAITMVMDKVEVLDFEAVSRGLMEVSDDYASKGVTSLCDMGSFGGIVEYYGTGLIDLVKQDVLKQRINTSGGMVTSISEVDQGIAIAKELHDKWDSDKCSFTFVKMFQDGTVEDQTAAISKPYVNTGTAPATFFTDDEIIQAGLKIAENGFDINTHCIGDMSARGLVKMTRALREAGYDDTRVTDSHSVYIYEGDVPEFGKLGILANTTFVWHAGLEAEDAVVPPGLPPSYQMKSVLNGGGKIGAGSDYPADLFGNEPIKGLQMGCTRNMYRDDVYPGTCELGPECEKLSMDDVITSYTISNAYQMRMEDKIGSIEVGKYADLVILDRNVFEIPIEEVYLTEVCETMMDGVTTYKK